MSKIRQIFAMASLILLLASPAIAQGVFLAYQAETENILKRRDAVTTDKEQPVFPLTLELGSARFTLSGLIEVEGSLIHVERGEEDDDLRLCTVQIGLVAELAPWLGGQITGLWEEDDTEPMEVDEAVLSLTPPWQLGARNLELHLGRQYLPFGSFASNMISDPVTLELGETHATAVVLALTGERWRASAAAFDGSIDNDGDDSLDDWVLAVEVTPRAGITLGASYLSDLAESGAGLVADEGLYRGEVSGWSAFVALQHHDFGLKAEYLAAVDRFEADQLESGGDLSGRHPQAWNLEFSWQATERLLLAGRYEGADDYQADVRRYGAATSYGLCDYALLAVEYLHADAAGEDPAHTFTAQLATEF